MQCLTVSRKIDFLAGKLRHHHRHLNFHPTSDVGGRASLPATKSRLTIHSLPLCDRT